MHSTYGDHNYTSPFSAHWGTLYSSSNKLLMEGDSYGDERFPKRLIEGLSRLSPIKVSFSPSSAQQTPNLIPSPSSPTKSVYGTIMDESYAGIFDATNISSASQPRLPELERNPPLRHPQHQYFQPTELLPEEQHPTRYRNHSLDFFEVSDSSDVDDSVRHNLFNSAPDMNAQRNALDLKSSTTTGPMHEMINFDTAHSVPQTEKFLKLTSEEDDPQRPHTQGESICMVPQLQGSDIPQSNADYLHFIPNARPVSDSLLQNPLLQRNNLWSLAPSQTHPQYYFGSSLLKADPINSIETITIQAFQALRAISRDGQSSAIGSSVPHKGIMDPSDTSIHSVLQTHHLDQVQNIDGPSIRPPLPPPSLPPQNKHEPTISNDTSLRQLKNISFPPNPFQISRETPHIDATPVSTTNTSTTHTALTSKAATVTIPPTTFERRSPAPKSPNPTSPFQSASSLSLSVRRRYASHGLLTVYLAIPSSSSSTTTTTTYIKSFFPPNGRKCISEILDSGPDFDDKAFFQELRRLYYDVLLGDCVVSRWWRRWASARSLRRIAVALVDARGGSCDDVAAVGNVYLAERLLRRFRRPGKGKRGFVWVQWARRLAVAGVVADAHGDYDHTGAVVAAAAGTTEEDEKDANVDDIIGLSSPSPDAQKQQQQHGLEFIEGWSVGRICAVVAFVVVVAVTVVFVWTFLGPDFAMDGAGEGRFVGDEREGREGRLVGAVLMGMLVLGIGWGGVGVWVFVSWVLM